MLLSIYFRESLTIVAMVIVETLSRFVLCRLEIRQKPDKRHEPWSILCMPGCEDEAKVNIRILFKQKTDNLTIDSSVMFKSRHGKVA